MDDQSPRWTGLDGDEVLEKHLNSTGILRTEDSEVFSAGDDFQCVDADAEYVPATLAPHFACVVFHRRLPCEDHAAGAENLLQIRCDDRAGVDRVLVAQA